jgi:DNA-binding response OmpR family regulator
LIADDNEGLREILVHALNRQGYRVRTASDGKAVLAALIAEEIHLLLLDLTLPELDGFTVLRHIRDERRGLFPYVIVMSGLTSTAVQEKVYALAADDFLFKPFSLPHLSARLRAFENLSLPRESSDQSA